ncbi:trypsin-like peptidase domain-containing protein [Massilia sp. H-1]|nr:trypsin-like peptidase domain-containing protein [Massilia sp. H-1]
MPDFTALAAASSPAVVTISAFTANDAGPRVDPFRQFFKERGVKETEPRAAPIKTRPDAIGASFLVSADGLIVTADFVVERAARLRVTLADGRRFKARLVGADARTGVALLKIDGGGLPLLPVGDSAALRAGRVGLHGRFAAQSQQFDRGRHRRRHRATDAYLPMIQTDLPFSPGNGGGPLLNLRGEVVGVVSQFISRGDGGRIGFSLPITEVMQAVNQLRSGSVPRYGRIGVSLGDPDAPAGDEDGAPCPPACWCPTSTRAGLARTLEASARATACWPGTDARCPALPCCGAWLAARPSAARPC